MLTQMRGFTRSWIAYVLIFILAALFVVFLGNGQSIFDTLQVQGSNYLAKGRDFTVTPQQLARELDLTLRSQRNQGQNISQQDAVEAGVHRRLLEGLAARKAAGAYADRVGVAASNAMVAERIRAIPMTQNPVSGAFDQQAYQQFLIELGYAQTDFENEIRAEIGTGMLLNALTVGVRAPSSYGAMALTYETETRVVSIAEAPASAIGAVPTPTSEQLQALYRESEQQLQIPEYRALTLVYARPQDFLARVTVPEERLNEELQARRAALVQPERRTYIRISAQSEAQANDAAQRLARGETPEAIAQALGVQSARGENQARNEVPDARIAEAVFSTPARAAPRVVRGQLAPWAVVRVDTVTAAVEPDMSAARNELRQAIALEEANTLLNDAVSAFEDARGGGATLVEAARQNGLAVVSYPAVDAQGRDQSGAPIEALAAAPDIVEAAFGTSEGEASDFLPAGEADVVVGVDRVIAATVRPFDTVRDQLAQAWTARERGRRLRAMGEAMVTAVQGGQDFAAAARAQRFRVVVNAQSVDRRAASQIPARGLPTQIFAAPEGGVSSDVRADGGGVLVAQVHSINRVNPEEQPQQLEALRAQMQQGLAQSLGEALQGQIVADARVRYNEDLLNRLYPSGQASAEADDTQ
jgi:peptidyl-prolyl cis-trans isomerase D